jgi:hypothetical protein
VLGAPRGPPYPVVSARNHIVSLESSAFAGALAPLRSSTWLICTNYRLLVIGTSKTRLVEE